jgi:hypothetical protein
LNLLLSIWFHKKKKKAEQKQLDDQDDQDDQDDGDDDEDGESNRWDTYGAITWLPMYGSGHSGPGKTRRLFDPSP